MISIETNPNYYLYSNLLSEGWIFGRKVDNSDVQYAQFRNHLPLLTVLACVYLITSCVFRTLTEQQSKTKALNQTYFYLIASMLILAALHGTGCVKIFIIITTSYLIGKFTGGSYWNPILTWAFNLLILFLNEYYNGYKFEYIGFPLLVSSSKLCTQTLKANANLKNRINTMVCCLDGIYCSNSVCLDLFLTIWIIIGNSRNPDHNMVDKRMMNF